MFESANLLHTIGKAAYRREQASLRVALLNAQYDLKLDGRFPVLILIAGVEGAGKGETVNLLNDAEIPMNDLVRTIEQVLGRTLSVVHEPLPPDDPARRRPDLTRARQLFGYQPKVTLEEGLQRTIAYFARELGSPA